MACFHPLHGYRAITPNPSGKYSIVFNVKQGYIDLPVTVPCGTCIGCRIERTRQWAIRCVHESKMHEQNCFITLTLEDKYLNKDRSLDKKVFQDFMKRFRKFIADDLLKEPGQRQLVNHKSPRYYHCGEYGETYGRPHYHSAIFGFDFPDKVLFADLGENSLYTSKILSKIWGLGHCTVGALTYDSAAYVARYIQKKITGKAAVFHYNDFDIDTGEIIRERLPEYTTMSKGIGKSFFEKYTADVYNFDHVIMKGKELRPPKYYDRLYELHSPEDFEKIKIDRRFKMEKYAPDNTTERLAVREYLAKRQLDDLTRSLDHVS